MHAQSTSILSTPRAGKVSGIHKGDVEFTDHVSIPPESVRMPQRQDHVHRILAMIDLMPNTKFLLQA